MCVFSVCICEHAHAARLGVSYVLCWDALGIQEGMHGKCGSVSVARVYLSLSLSRCLCLRLSSCLVRPALFDTLATLR